MRRNTAFRDGEPEDEGPSKTQLKREMHELQQLGLALLGLSDSELELVAMEDSLREALHEYKRLRFHEARRRQAQYIGKLVRAADPEPLRRAVAILKDNRKRDAAALHEAETWRDRLIEDDQALDRWIARHPGSDRPLLRAQIRNARRERAAAIPEGAARKGRAYRELFQTLRTELRSARGDSDSDSESAARDAD